jgi:Xaa-Pro aminopeptidase
VTVFEKEGVGQWKGASHSMSRNKLFFHLFLGLLVVNPAIVVICISLMLTDFWYTLAPNRVKYLMSIKNGAELEALRKVKFLAWLDIKLCLGYEITEWEAAWRINEFRTKQKKFMGLAYETISANGPNAVLLYYTPKKHSVRTIDQLQTPYLMCVSHPSFF